MKIKHLVAIATFTKKHQFKGLERILRIIYNPDDRIKDSFNIITNYDDNLLIHIDSASFMEWNIFFYGYYEPKTVNLIKRLIRSDSVVVDVGANVGMFTLLMAKRAKYVIAVEPHPDIFKRLLMNVSLNRLTNIEAVECALTDEKSGNTILQSFGKGASIKSSSRYATESSVEIPVKMKTFDGVFKKDRLDFIKIDTDGDDLKVIYGAKKSIQKFRPHILFEYGISGWKLAGSTLGMAFEFFSDLNYFLYAINDKGYLEHMTDKKFKNTSRQDILAVPN